MFLFVEESVLRRDEYPKFEKEFNELFLSPSALGSIEDVAAKFKDIHVVFIKTHPFYSVYDFHEALEKFSTTDYLTDYGDRYSVLEFSLAKRERMHLEDFIFYYLELYGSDEGDDDFLVLTREKGSSLENFIVFNEGENCIFSVVNSYRREE